MSTISRRDYARALLVGAVTPRPRDTALNVVVAWMYAESGRAPCDGVHGAAYNPLNTTLVTRGSRGVAFNDAGVQDYISMEDGLAATISTLAQDNFQRMRVALASSGLSGDSTANAIEMSDWGTGGVLSGVLKDYRHNPSFYDSLKIGG